MKSFTIWKTSMRVFGTFFFFAVIMGLIIPFIFERGTYLVINGVIWKVAIFMTLPVVIAYCNIKREKNKFKEGYFKFFVYNTFVWYKEKYPKPRTTRVEVFLLILITLLFLVILLLWSSVSVLMPILIGKSVLESIILFLAVCIFFHIVSKED